MKGDLTMLKISPKNILLFNGIIWSIASLMVFKHVFHWGALLTFPQLLLHILLGNVIALFKMKRVFFPMTIKNISRIRSLSQAKISIAEYQERKSKIIMVVMILMGVTLRNLLHVPYQFLMPLYLGIGIAMSSVTFLYIRAFVTIDKTVTG